MFKWQYLHIFDELKRYNIDFILFNPGIYGSPEAGNEAFIEYVRNTTDKFDLFFTCMGDEWLYPETVSMVKDILSIPTVLFCADNLEIPFSHKSTGKLFDIVWLTSIETEYLFKKWGCNTVFQTYAANPYRFVPDWETQINKVGFIGTPYGSRTNKINLLLNGDIDCAVYSNSLLHKGYSPSLNGNKNIRIHDLTTKLSRYVRFPIGRKVLYSSLKNKFISSSKLDLNSEHLEINGSVPFEGMCNLYSNMALSLNIIELKNTYILKNPIYKMHLRSFEIPMCGGLQITSYNNEIASYFEDGKEIILYRTDEELIDKCHYYLDNKHNKEILKMKKAAYERAKNEHTWYNRFQRVLKEINIEI